VCAAGTLYQEYLFIPWALRGLVGADNGTRLCMGSTDPTLLCPSNLSRGETIFWGFKL
jgi:hypothetical protein